MNGEDLTLDLLSEDKDDLLLEDFVINDNPLSKNLDDTDDESSLTQNKEKPEDKPKDKTSDPVKKVESVAGEEDKDKIPDNSQQKSNSSPSDNKMSQIYSSIAAHFQETGVLPSLNLKDTPIKSAEDLQKAVDNEIKNALDAKVRAYEEAVQRGVPEDKYIAYERQMKDLDRITPEVINSEESTQLRLNIIGQDFLNKGYQKEEALKFAQRSIDLGEDKEDAARALNNIKEFTKSNFDKEVEKIKEVENKTNTDLKDFIDKREELIKGIKINSNVKEKLFKQITTPIMRDKNGNPLSQYGKALTEKPVEMRVINEYLFMITKGFTDFSKITNSIETGKTRDLDNILKSNGAALLEGGKIDFNNTDEDSQFLFEDLKIDA